MSVRIAILGASGAVGSTLALHILRSGLLEPQDRLMLVAHGTDSLTESNCAVTFSSRANDCRRHCSANPTDGVVTCIRFICQ
jgi:hypothetical protein